MVGWNGGKRPNGGSILVALLAVCADESIEQQRQPVPGKLPQHLYITAHITTTVEAFITITVTTKTTRHLHVTAGITTTGGQQSQQQ